MTIEAMSTNSLSIRTMKCYSCFHGILLLRCFINFKETNIAFVVLLSALKYIVLNSDRCTAGFLQLLELKSAT
jgi:hypothetical protein